MAKCPARLFDIRPLVEDVVFVLRQLIHKRVVEAKMIQNEIAEFLDASELSTTDVVHLARHEVARDVGQTGNEVVDVHENAVVAKIYIVGKAVQCAIGKKTHDAAIVVVVLAGSIGIEKSQTDNRIAEPLLEIHDPAISAS